jgi:two-component system sensor histidine kinase KdpD
MENVAAAGAARRVGDVSYVPVRLGSRVVGSLGLAGNALGEPEQDSIGNLVAIGYERIQALRRAAEAEAARQGERLRTFVLDGVAHDLKTPLTAIKTCVTTLITIPPQSEEQRSELLAIIDEETERLHARISEAIQLARVESGKVTLEKRQLDVADCISAILKGRPGGERVAVSIPAGSFVIADPELFQQALRQVIENALQYSQSVVEVDALQSGADLTIRVSDRGPGIHPRELERIFEKFYRGSRARKELKGSGMGLAIARGIIEAHGGRIWAENRDGGGAVFVVHLQEHEG